MTQSPPRSRPSSLASIDLMAGELSDRQQVILEYVVEDYVADGQPVGSKALAGRRRMAGVCVDRSYELAELQGLGYLTHPHTSAGRVPTDRGYRYYVDRLLETLEPPAVLPSDLTGTAERDRRGAPGDHGCASQVTHLLALVTAPPLESTVVRHIDVLLLQPQVVVVVVITSTGRVGKRVFVFEEPVDPGLADWARAYLNEQVAGLSLGARQLHARFEDAGLSDRERSFLVQLRPAFTDLVEPGEQEVYVGGAAGLMDEFRSEEISAFQRLLEALERRRMLLDLASSSLGSRRPFVRVGAELRDPALAGVSVVGAPYGLSHRNLGTVSLVGPTRMDYVKALGAVRAAAHELSRFVQDLYEE